MQVTYPSGIANARVWLALLDVVTSVVTATLNLALPSIRSKGIQKLSNRTHEAHNVWESNLKEVCQCGQRKNKNNTTLIKSRFCL
jgi:hypothetical protein